jgi:hypothetical protein
MTSLHTFPGPVSSQGPKNKELSGVFSFSLQLIVNIIEQNESYFGPDDLGSDSADFQRTLQQIVP